MTTPPKPSVTAAPDSGHLIAAAVRPLAAKIVVIAGRDEGVEIALDGKVDVGTDARNDLVLTDPAVSRRHAAFSVVGGRIMIEDRASRNGTFLGHVCVVQAEVPLGSVITVGDTSLAIQPRWYTREVKPSSARQFGELIGESVAMREVFAILERVAPTDVGVLIEGESGTGKEVAARSLHAASRRAANPYVVFDCGAVSREIVESELFGHRQGAFTGAIAARAGAFRRAHGGTLCLDEIGELPLDLQPKLLRVLEAGEVRGVGDDEVHKVDVRIIAATNRDLRAEAHRGRFREDLLYRLEVVKVRIPSLRQRPEDIPALVAHFAKGRLPPGDTIAGENVQRLVEYSWPGNARELRNVIDRAVALAAGADGTPAPFEKLVFNLGPGAASPATFGMSYPGVAAAMPYKEAKAQLLASFDRSYLDALLARCGGNITRAAAQAGLSRRHLYSLIQRASGADGERAAADDEPGGGG